MYILCDFNQKPKSYYVFYTRTSIIQFQLVILFWSCRHHNDYILLYTTHISCSMSSALRVVYVSIKKCEIQCEWWFPRNLSICMQIHQTKSTNDWATIYIFFLVLFNYRPCYFYYIHMAHTSYEVIAISITKSGWKAAADSLGFGVIYRNPTQHCNSQMFKLCVI